jgi:hypothetical protein
MAATSVEQTPDPRHTLRELYRVLRPEGRLRIKYEALGMYRGEREREAWIWPINDEVCRLILYDRHIEQESVTQYGLTFPMSEQQLLQTISGYSSDLSIDMITVPVLQEVQPAVTDARICRLTHPSGVTLAAWLKEIGFSNMAPTCGGSEFAVGLFDEISPEKHPADIEGVDDILRPVVKVAVRMPAPLSDDPMITAVK